MELNKIAAAILLAGLIAMITGKVSQVLYFGADHHGGEHHEARGYSIDVAEASDSGHGEAPKEDKLEPITPLLATADIAAGEAFFKKRCTTCHNADQGGKAMTGPNLWGVVDRPRASMPGFNYSKAMVEKGGSWDVEELSGFLHNPKKWVPGTMMAFAGIKKDSERADLIAYLHSLK